MTRHADTYDELKAEWMTLRNCWLATREQWRDDVAVGFERGRWQEWEERVPAFLRALEDLEAVSVNSLEETD
jgi:hypothetical protein